MSTLSAPLFRVGFMKYIIYWIILCFLSLPCLAGNTDEILKRRWIEVKTENFHVISDSKPKLAKVLIEELELFKFYLGVISSLQPKHDIPPLKVFSITSGKIYDSLDPPQESDGYYIHAGNLNYAVVRSSGYIGKTRQESYRRKVFYHEYIHYMVKNSKYELRIPLWYEEALADFMSTMRVSKKKIKFGYPPRDIWYTHKILSVEPVFKMIKYPEEKLGRQKFYENARVILHYLWGDEDRRLQLGNFLDKIYLGKSVDRAFAEAFRMNYEEFARKLRNYVRKGQLYYLSMPKKEKFIAPQYYERVLSAAESAYHFSNMLRHRDRNYWKRAEYLLLLSIKADRLFVPAYLSLIRLKFWQDKIAEANTYIRKVCKLAPDDSEVQKAMREYKLGSCMTVLLGAEIS